MQIKAINTSYTSNIYKNKRKLSEKISFRANENDTFESKHIEMLKRDMYKNPKLYYEDVREEKCDLNDMFYVALLLRKEERVKPDTQDTQKRIEKYVKKLEKAKKIILKKPDDFVPNATSRFQNAIDHLKEKLDACIKSGKDNERIRVWGKISRMISEKNNFNPNLTMENGKSLMEIAIDNNDKDLGILLIKNKKFKKPLIFKNEDSEIVYQDWEKDAKKKSFLQLLGLKK